MAESESPPSALVLSDRPLTKKLVGELRDISSAMGLKISLHSNAKKDKILLAIQRALKNDAEIANDPRFIPLLAHRSAPTVGGKTSAEKAMEEAVEAAKPPLPAIGCVVLSFSFILLIGFKMKVYSSLIGGKSSIHSPYFTYPSIPASQAGSGTRGNTHLRGRKWYCLSGGRKQGLPAFIQSHLNLAGQNQLSSFPLCLASLAVVSALPPICPPSTHLGTSRRLEIHARASSRLFSAKPAHRALLSENIKTDPPGQYKKLSQISGPKQKAPSGPESDDDSDSTPASLGPQSAPQTPEVKPRDLKAPDVKEIQGIVQVNFYDERNFLAAPRQVYVDHPVRMSVGDDEERKYFTQLSQLIPAAVEQDSPIKGAPVSIHSLSTRISPPARGGRLYRPKIREDCTQHLHIGTIDAVLAGSSRALQPSVVNEYIMHHSHDGLFSCDLFWDNYAAPGDGGAGAGTFLNEIHSTQDLPYNGSISDLNPNQMPQMANNSGDVFQTNVPPPVGDIKPVEFHNAPMEKPLEIARNRAAANPLHKDAPPELRAEFAQDLYRRVRTVVLDLPDYGEEWPRCKFAGQMRVRYVNQQAAFQFFEPLGGSLGAYMLTRNDPLWPGVRFKKDFLYEVLSLKSSSTTEIDSWFSSKMLEGAPKAKAWVESGGKTNSSKFEKMKTADFKRYLTAHHKSDAHPTQSRKHKKSSSDDDGNRRRRRRLSSEGLDDSDE
ncbi:hypothetical protein C8R45DRAFT_1101576 [Mycena sanguinolenta]|nr:hypothetical protein C8R45DRAFT_1101576 [Mycena sanguinolenta]